MEVTREVRPIVLIRGFGGLDTEEERDLTHQGFNVGSHYPHKRGQNYIYPGLVLSMIRSKYGYHDATNTIGYYARAQSGIPDPLPEPVAGLPKSHFEGTVIVDPFSLEEMLERGIDMRRTLWVFRYYDLGSRTFDTYRQALMRAIELIQDSVALQTGTREAVNVIAHSMGGLIARDTLQLGYKTTKAAHAAINKLVTLGTPHQGIAFQRLPRLDWLGLSAEDELEAFNPETQADAGRPGSFKNLARSFDPRRLLCIVGTNYRDYMRISSLANRFSPLPGEGGLLYNRSDGLVKHSAAQIPGAYRTFVHKTHGGYNSLVTARESCEVAMRFLFGNTRMRVFLERAEVRQKSDRFGRDEVYVGLSVKARRLDFDLFHQSAAAENCYGPFSKPDLLDGTVTWAGEGRLMWEGFLDGTARPDGNSDIALRLSLYAGERDLTGIGFSDETLLQEPIYLQLRDTTGTFGMFSHPDMGFSDPASRRRGRELKAGSDGWRLDVGNERFTCTLRFEVDTIPPNGPPSPLKKTESIDPLLA
ncbi:hypothetical protein OCH239_00640 [Roseivivax halodurans JCM 10272]|uniref:GPI inositol-deacylase PGAP1-like alpha/beta domain-containing protein n=1 Tax=Roseivivax halodurans JCM 10272 TaxID=1449350 RepID=X7ELC5_9RHOB|nr:hypothetical protein [Roseivivax halodurans]ETX16710.1 hypothetical protein OCH239_00640 [Roseivivax halodurans JCM 10272]